MRRGGVLLVVLAAIAGLGLLAAFAALGGTTHLRAGAATASADPCTAKVAPAQGGPMEAEASTILLTSLNAAACSLHVSRDDLVLALGRGGGLDVAAQTLGVAPTALQDAVISSIKETVTAETAAGRVKPTTALAIQTLVDVVPPEQLLAAARNESGGCAPVAWKQVGDLKQIAAEVGVLTGLRAACALHVSPIEAVSALADPAGLEGLAQRAGKSQAEVEQAVRASMVASINQAQQAGALSSTEGSVLGSAAAVAPIDRILAIVRGDDDPCAAFPWSKTSSTGQALAQVAMIGVVDAACQLGAPTFDVFAALANPTELTTLEQTTGKSEADINTAIKSGLQKGLTEGQDAGDVSGLVAFGLNLALSQANVLDLLSNFVG